ncbi:semaphorin-2A-like [Tropilaelaps mercedesae]|uniref:Semaphorin-2A n=1 Tax=Tropilaelaps mercedesae TaxID=418985 RepID=A0A1V9XIF2_9ACAR|nr:semaphorin-2A-like [Tropilaelaps mercedesae]
MTSLSSCAALLCVATLATVGCGATNLVSKAHVRLFSCGKLHYRTFYFDHRHDALYVGAMDRVFKLPTKDINRTRCDVDSLALNPHNVQSCVSKGKSEQYECRNHIKVIQPMGRDRLYVCGTNAQNPKDWVVHANLSHVHDTIPGVGSGVAKCPFDPDDNSTAVWVEKGNPGDLPGLYSGTVAEFTKADTVIFRTDLYDQTTRQKKYHFKRTIKYDSKWLDRPNFVGSFDIGEYVYFFFRESAVEYINCGKSVYSRVARICKRDTGGKNILNKNWATYLKARLNCSIPGDYPFYFNEIQAVYKIPGDDRMFYAVFTTPMNGLCGSAVCSFSLDSINEVFNGKFKEQETSSSSWLPVFSSKVPEPRPGSCVNDTQTLPDSVLNFIRGHSLMDSAVSHAGGRPVYHRANVVFTALAVHREEVDGVEYTIYYAGSRDGRVFKLVQGNTGSQQPYSELVDVMRVTSPEPVRSMEFSAKHRALFVASDSGVVQLEVVMCRTRHKTCNQCVRDPYCGWDPEQQECRPYSTGFIQDVSGQMPSACAASLKRREIRAFWGETLHLATCVDPQRHPQGQPPQWRHNGVEVTIGPRKFLTWDGGLVIMGANQRDAGRYEQSLTPTGGAVCAHNVTIDTQTCTAPNEGEYRKIYSDWCHEMERYKTARKSWEQKQQKCANSPPLLSNPNDLSFNTV